MSNQKTVFVGMSGGVDSSVAALRLKQQGYKVVGVFIKVWHPDFLVCNWEQERLDAMRVAAHLEIPFLTCDAETAYRDDVAHYFISEYKAGRTPNPDVMCNKHVKFGAFIKFAKKHGADYIATGHYTRRIDSEAGSSLHRGLDSNKDQSYFLYTLTKEQLDYSLFPVGDTNKEQIRKEAEQAKLPTATKKDSQGVCFLGHIDIKDFLSHYVELTPGRVLDTKGNTIGQHEGALIYTTGQRQGFTINTHTENREAFYVVSKDITNNTITVDSTHPTLRKSSYLTVSNSILREKVEVGNVLEAQTRYRQKPFRVRVDTIAFDQLELELIESSEAVALGQSCVLYRGDVCIGGGIIA